MSLIDCHLINTEVKDAMDDEQRLPVQFSFPLLNRTKASGGFKNFKMINNPSQ